MTKLNYTLRPFLSTISLFQIFPQSFFENELSHLLAWSIIPFRESELHFQTVGRGFSQEVVEMNRAAEYGAVFGVDHYLITQHNDGAPLTDKVIRFARVKLGRIGNSTKLCEYDRVAIFPRRPTTVDQFQCIAYQSTIFIRTFVNLKRISQTRDGQSEREYVSGHRLGWYHGVYHGVWGWQHRTVAPRRRHQGG